MPYRAESFSKAHVVEDALRIRQLLGDHQAKTLSAGYSTPARYMVELTTASSHCYSTSRNSLKAVQTHSGPRAHLQSLLLTQQPAIHYTGTHNHHNEYTIMSDPTSGTLPSLESSTPGNDGATVVLIAYIFLVFTVLTIIGRISANVTRKRGLEQEDGIMILATVWNTRIFFSHGTLLLTEYRPLLLRRVLLQKELWILASAGTWTN
jgi:hypothetical protein